MAARETLETAGCPGGEISFALVGDRKISELNRTYTGREGPTDVLAFPMDEDQYLGEVVISLESCRRQSEERGVSFEEELSLLVAHGVLHLAGYDHTGDRISGERMRDLEAAVLARLGFGL